MRKKLLWIAGIIALGLAVTAGVVRYSEIQKGKVILTGK